MIDPRACYRAVKAKDERFDGRFFVGVKSTGVYCRPVCPATPARFESCAFYPSAAAAQSAGFRPCLRCRPETVADLGAWCGTSNTVSRGLSLIAEGALDGKDADIESLAERLGVSGRHLRRLFEQYLGASPVAVAQTRRVLFAKQLLHETTLPMTDVALASGFGSVRRFNETFQALFRRPPSALRRDARGRREGARATTAVAVALRYRPPFDWDSLLAFVSARAIPGVERVKDGVYSRTIVVDGRPGSIEVAHSASARSLAVVIRLPSVLGFSGVVTRLRRMFDLTADVATIGSHLARDPLLSPLVAKRPGLRVPGGWDGFEIAVRAVLGQQVTVEGARKSVARLAELCGDRLESSVTGSSDLFLAFPTAAQVLKADLAPLPVPAARKRALTELSRAATGEEHLFAPRATVEETILHLRNIHGVGDWTAAYIALRASREPDAFPFGDAGLRRSLLGASAEPKARTALERRAEAWRPWRAYAAQHLWAEDAARRAKGRT